MRPFKITLAEWLLRTSERVRGWYVAPGMEYSSSFARIMLVRWSRLNILGCDLACWSRRMANDYFSRHRSTSRDVFRT